MTTQLNRNRFGAGYQAALTDIREKFAEGGWEAVHEWIQLNSVEPLPEPGTPDLDSPTEAEVAEFYRDLNGTPDQGPAVTHEEYVERAWQELRSVADLPDLLQVVDRILEEVLKASPYGEPGTAAERYAVNARRNLDLLTLHVHSHGRYPEKA